jgi:hypothetical protein
LQHCHGPLPLDNGFDCILSITDRIGSDIHIVPTRTDINAEDLALLFFDHWYCKNGLPTDIACDHDKLFVSRFWKALTKIMGIKLKMSSSFHPKTDGSSERFNKTINQILHYHVKHNQKGWVHALPRICFQIMNTVNASTHYSGFQLHLGRSPRIISPIIPSELPIDLADAVDRASDIIQKLTDDVADARDNLLLAKFSQSHYANSSRAPDPQYSIGG